MRTLPITGKLTGMSSTVLAGMEWGQLLRTLRITGMFTGMSSTVLAGMELWHICLWRVCLNGTSW